MQIFKKKNQNFEHSIEDVKEKISNLIQMIEKEKVTIRKYLSIVTKFRVSLNDLVDVILEPKLLKVYKGQKKKRFNYNFISIKSN